MSFAKEFIKAAADNTGLAAEKLAQKVKNERVDHDAEHGEILSIREAFKKVVTKELPKVASVEFVDKSICVDKGIEGTIQTQEAVRQAYERLEAEESLQEPMIFMIGQALHPKDPILEGRKLPVSPVTWDAYEEDRLKQSLRVPALTWR